MKDNSQNSKHRSMDVKIAFLDIKANSVIMSRWILTSDLGFQKFTVYLEVTH